MKRIICMLLALALCLPLMLTSCFGRQDPVDEDLNEDSSESQSGSDNNAVLDSEDKDDGQSDDNKKPSNQGGQSNNNGNTNNDNTNNGGNNDGGDQGGTQIPIEPDVDLPAGAQSKKIYT